jgi:hypothetical protein
MIKTELDLTADTIDTRDIIARFEELEELQSDHEADPTGGHFSDEDALELANLTELLDELDGMGGDEKWRGNWYPVTLIANECFKAYAQQLAEDIGAIDEKAAWPNNCIDWDHAANELKHDYSAVEIGRLTYWTR